MRSEPLDHDPFVLKANAGHHAVSVSLDIENDPAIGNEISASEISLHCIEVLPFSFSDCFELRCQIGF